MEYVLDIWFYLTVWTELNLNAIALGTLRLLLKMVDALYVLNLVEPSEGRTSDGCEWKRLVAPPLRSA